MRGQRRRLDVIRAATGGGSGPRALGLREPLVSSAGLHPPWPGCGHRRAPRRSPLAAAGQKRAGGSCNPRAVGTGVCEGRHGERREREKGREKRDGKKKERGKGKGSYVERKTIRRMKGRGDKNERGMKKKKRNRKGKRKYVNRRGKQEEKEKEGKHERGNGNEKEKR